MRGAVLVAWVSCLACLMGCRIGFDNGPESIAGHQVTYSMDRDASGGKLGASDSKLTGTCAPGACPTLGAGHIQGAAVFAGNGDVLLPTRKLVTGDDYTMTVWIDVPAVVTDNGTIASKASTESPSDVFQLLLLGGYPVFETTPDGVSVEYLNRTIGTQESLLGTGWRHIAASWDGTTKRLYLDGALIGEFAPVAVVDSLEQIIIGCDKDNGVPRTYFEGSMDELVFYDRALDLDEIELLAAR